MKKKIIEAIKKGELYDFISNYYPQINLEELKDLVLELWCVLHSRDIDWQANEELINNLIEYRDWGH